VSYPVAAKTSAAGVSAAVSGAVLYVLQRYVFKGVVPDGIASVIYIAMPGALAFAAAYLAPHQNRPLPYDQRGPLPPGVTMTRIGPVGPVDPETGRPPAGYPPQEERLDIKTEPGI
jgi:hypothetical protein